MTMRYKYKLSRFYGKVFLGGKRYETTVASVQKRIKYIMNQIRILQKKDCMKEI